MDQNLALVMQGNIAICHRSLSIAASVVAARWKVLVQNPSVCPFGVSVPRPPRRGRRCLAGPEGHHGDLIHRMHICLERNVYFA